MRVLSVMAVLFAPAVAHTVKHRATEPRPPPDPMGELPLQQEDGSFGSQADACQACRYMNTGSCATYATCICHATNAHFDIVGVPVTDKDNWKYACDADGGSKYVQCFSTGGATHIDAFGDSVDPNNKKCPDQA